MSRFFVAALIAAGAAAVDSVTCTQNAHSVGALPYWNPDDTQPCSYAGTLPSNAEGTHHLFYWLYPAVDENAPLIIWINGGPGASSMFGNFLEMGPMRITRPNGGADNNDFLVSLDPDNWSTLGHFMVIDQPVGTGFSWGEPLLTNMEETANEWVYYLTQVFAMYPEFVGKDLFFTGESYGGKYLPAYSYAMLMHNINNPGFFGLKGTLCGDPYTAPVTQRLSMAIVPEALNVIDESNMPQVAAIQRRCLINLTNRSMTDAEKGDICASLINYIMDVSGDVFGYNTQIFAQDWDPIEQIVSDYFTISGQVQ